MEEGYTTQARNQRLTEAVAEALRREVPGIEAALLRIQATADMTTHECEHCHFLVKHAFRDTQLSDGLRGVRSKLRRWEDEAGGRKKL